MKGFRARGVAPVIEYLPNKCKALSLKPSTKKGRKKGRKEGGKEGRKDGRKEGRMEGSKLSTFGRSI
jgi:flagellar biosynthesis/type III secretory pathway protein FliH